MENALEKVFEGQRVRFIPKDEEVLVPLPDIAMALDYKKEALWRIVDRSKDVFDSFIVIMTIHVGDQGYETICLNRDGVVGLLMKLSTGRIKNPAKKKIIVNFQKWAIRTISEIVQGILHAQNVERGEMVSIGYLSSVVQSLRQEINRLSDIVTAASIPSGIPSGPHVIYLPRPYRRHSFDDEALAFLHELFNRKPRARIAELERQLRRESVKECWKVGSRASVYRAVESFREKEICVV